MKMDLYELTFVKDKNGIFTSANIIININSKDEIYFDLKPSNRNKLYYFIRAINIYMNGNYIDENIELQLICGIIRVITNDNAFQVYLSDSLVKIFNDLEKTLKSETLQIF